MLVLVVALLSLALVTAIVANIHTVGVVESEHVFAVGADNGRPVHIAHLRRGLHAANSLSVRIALRAWAAVSAEGHAAR